MPRRKVNDDDALDAELAKRGLIAKPTIDYRIECHAKQASFVESLVTRASRFLSALCGRQSGKSHGAVMAALIIASSTPDVAIIYVTSTDANVRKMAFEPARKLNRKHKLGGTAKESSPSKIVFTNGSTIYFIGADSDRTIERLRGTPNLILCIIDECGIYGSDILGKMIEAVTPGLRPMEGALVLMGTPSLEGPQGRFYEATQNPTYQQHRFGYKDNDRVKSFAKVEQLIDEELEALNYTRDSAYFRREYLCEFVVELSERVYQLAEGNYFDGDVPTDLDAFLTGGDLGMSANDSLVTIGWKKRDPTVVWVVEEREASGQDALAFAAMADDVNKRRHPICIAVDAGALGQKVIKTVKTLMPTIPIVEANKPPVAIQVRAVNILAQSFRLKIRRNSKLAQELGRPTWVNGIVGGEIDEHGKHSDLAPALRYAVLAATPYLPQIKGPQPQLSAAQKAQAKEDAELARAWKPSRPLGLPDQLADILGPRRIPGDSDW